MGDGLAEGGRKGHSEQTAGSWAEEERALGTLRRHGRQRAVGRRNGSSGDSRQGHVRGAAGYPGLAGGGGIAMYRCCATGQQAAAVVAASFHVGGIWRAGEGWRAR